MDYLSINYINRHFKIISYFLTFLFIPKLKSRYKFRTKIIKIRIIKINNHLLIHFLIIIHINNKIIKNQKKQLIVAYNKVNNHYKKVKKLKREANSVIRILILYQKLQMEQFLHVKRDWQKRMHKECIQNNKHKKNSLQQEKSFYQIVEEGKNMFQTQEDIQQQRERNIFLKNGKQCQTYHSLEQQIQDLEEQKRSLSASRTFYQSKSNLSLSNLQQTNQPQQQQFQQQNDKIPIKTKQYKTKDSIKVHMVQSKNFTYDINKSKNMSWQEYEQQSKQKMEIYKKQYILQHSKNPQDVKPEDIFSLSTTQVQNWFQNFDKELRIYNQVQASEKFKERRRAYEQQK